MTPMTRDELGAALITALDDRDQLRAEIERLLADNTELRTALNTEIDNLLVIKRLRAALDDCIHGRRDWMEKARRALENKP